ncbi:MAG TPA: DUF1178 family protein [Patescibacteria group bacterium]|nr:DUF1178 family protein [Patescibacteria group bacterium]
MILFNLICSRGHEFEGWFRDGAAYDHQAAAGDLSCPVCSDKAVRKAVMAPSLVSNRPPPARAAAELREMLSSLRDHVETTAENVGDRFPEEARRMHYGEADERAIYGEASADEAEALRDEGVNVVSIPWPSRRDS